MNLMGDFKAKGPISQIISRLTGLEIQIRNILAVLNSIPHLTTAERNAVATPVPGTIIYNTTTGKLNLYVTSWEEIEASSGLHVLEGANATMGIVALVGGVAVVNTNKVTANSRIFLTSQSLGTILRPTGVGVTARVAGVSFTITSMDITDTSSVAWMIVEPY
jgi:hypothetical protein